MVTESKEGGEIGRRWPKGTKLQSCKMNKSKDLIHSMMTTVNTVLNTRDLL